MGREQPLVTSMNERLLVAIGRSIAAVPDSAGHSFHALVRPGANGTCTRPAFFAACSTAAQPPKGPGRRASRALSRPGQFYPILTIPCHDRGDACRFSLRAIAEVDTIAGQESVPHRPRL